MGAQDKVPDALQKRHVTISLSEGGVFVIKRWSTAKTLMMAGWMAKVISGVDMASLKGDFMEVAQKFVTLLGDKVPEFMQLAVEPEDRGDVMELPGDDGIEVLVEIIKLNVTEKFRKKVKELFGLFPQNPGKST